MAKDKTSIDEYQFCPECRAEARNMRRDSQQELEKLAAERNEAQELLKDVVKGHSHLTADMFKKWEDCPNCKPQLESLIQEKYIKPAFTKGFDKGKESIGLDDVKAWLKANAYLEPIREIIVQRGKK